MQAKFSSLRVVVAVLVTSLILASCSSGGTGGSSWFNLPSVPASIGSNGMLSVLGFDVMALPAATVSQLESAGVGQIEVRAGYDGLFLFADGEPLPALTWDSGAFDSIQQILNSPAIAPTLASAGVSGDTIAGALPWLRRVGLGAMVTLPGASADAAKWDGTPPAYSPTGGDAEPIGPLTLGAISLGDSGLTVAGVPLSTLGVNVAIPSMVTDLLQGIGAEQLSIDTEPTGLNLQAGGLSLPGLSYDAASLQRTLALAGPFLGDSPMMGQISDLVARLPGSDINVTVGLGNEPAGETSLPAIPLQVMDDGQLSVYGFPVAALPADLLDALQNAGVGQLNVSLNGTSLNLAVNGNVLPAIDLGEGAPARIQALASSLGGVDPALVGGALDILNGLGSDISVALALPGNEPAPMPDFAAADTSPVTLDNPAIQLGVALSNGEISSLGNLPASLLSDLGVALPALPANIVSLLNDLDVGVLQILNTGERIVVQGDGEVLLSLNYGGSLNELLTLLGPVLGEDLVSTIEPFLPLATSQSLNLVVSLDGSTLPDTAISGLDVAIMEGGGLAVFGSDLGLGNLVPANIVSLLQNINLQDVDVIVRDNQLFLGANGEPMPNLTWSDGSLSIIGTIVSAFVPALPQDVLNTGLGLLDSANLGISAAVPAGPNAEAVSVPDSFDPTAVTYAPADISEADRPVIRAEVTIENGEITAIGSESADSLPVAIPTLPANIMGIFSNLDYDQVVIVMLPNDLEIQNSGGETLLSLAHDADTLTNLLAVVGPLFLPEPLLSRVQDPAQRELIAGGLMPLLVGSDLEITVNLP